MVKSPPANTGDKASLPESGRSWREKGSPLQCSCLGIPWKEEPGGQQSVGSQRVGHDLVTKQRQVSGGIIIVLRNGVIVRKIMFYQIHNKVYLFYCIKICSSGMGNTCKSMADSCQCMTKTTTLL